MHYDDEFKMFTIITMLFTFIISFVGIGLILAIMLSSVGLAWIGMLIGIAVGLFTDYKLYQFYKG